MPIPKCARASLAAHGVAAVADWRDLLGKVDLVSICTPAVTHAAIVRAFLNSGAHVLVEKPIATSLEEADALIALAERDRQGSDRRPSGAFRLRPHGSARFPRSAAGSVLLAHGSVDGPRRRRQRRARPDDPRPRPGASADPRRRRRRRGAARAEHGPLRRRGLGDRDIPQRLRRPSGDQPHRADPPPRHARRLCRWRDRDRFPHPQDAQHDTPRAERAGAGRSAGRERRRVRAGGAAGNAGAGPPAKKRAGRSKPRC